MHACSSEPAYINVSVGQVCRCIDVFVWRLVEAVGPVVAVQGLADFELYSSTVRGDERAARADMI